MFMNLFLLFSLYGCAGPSVVALPDKSNDSNDSGEDSVEDTETAPPAEEQEPPNIGINPRIHRLTHSQWRNATQDLLGIDASSFSEQFLDDGLSEGFENNGAALSVDSILFQDYQRAAESLAYQVISSLEHYERIVPEDQRSGGSTIAYSERIEAESEDAVATTGAAYATTYNLWSNGTLSVEKELPASGLYEFSALVNGTDCGDGVGADMELQLNGIIVHSQNVLGEQEVSVELDIPVGLHTFSVAFTNDCYVPDDGLDRNLFIDWIEISGGVDLGTSTSELSDMRSWSERFLSQAFRRPLSNTELDVWHALFVQGASLFQSGDDIADGVQFLITAALQSPDFLYRIENTAAGERLSAYELASKLSFQICNSPPDQELRDDLVNGSFPENLSLHAERFLNAECGQEAILDLHRQLFQLDAYENIYRTDPIWNAELNQLLREEIEQFILWHVYTENGTVKGLYTANYTIANREIAALYGIDLDSDDFIRIELNPSERSGILTLAGPLAKKAEITQSSPIHRGVFINDAIFCKTLPPPPDDVSGLPAQEAGMTNRERVEAHTGAGTCGEGCHSSLINPPGFAFENYDQLGRYRTEDNAQPINAAASFYFENIGELSWNNAVEFSQLVSESYEAHQCYSQHLYSYFLGRELQDIDQSYLEELRAQSMADLSIRDLIVSIVMSDSFQYRGVE